ncbi:hypothetical protein MUN82_06455 [Hymenobacter aerilatus]|uniref:Uncharacterized protein n=1 Tax=Hymenobacter aerilatus TaxID=2932251 RepID=A0A8T9T3P9_9BACT|nr:hypothetical protein [Hymenobacter aerilatus]UOR06736.1 hypothetical protein MUN82_06455 [Hymenobacter aerilatus]
MALKSFPQLRPEVAAKYEATIVPTRIEIQRLRRTIDLCTLTLAEADELVKDPQFTYLVAKQPRKGKRTKSATTVTNS